jgi:hypothetical protein
MYACQHPMTEPQMSMCVRIYGVCYVCVCVSTLWLDTDGAADIYVCMYIYVCVYVCQHPVARHRRSRRHLCMYVYVYVMHV